MFPSNSNSSSSYSNCFFTTQHLVPSESTLIRLFVPHAHSSPIEAFNDSNTSEFDCAEWGDSRQETSLDYNHANYYEQQDGLPERPHHNSPNENQSDTQSTASSNRESGSPNELVMDADLRQASRLNLELLVLANATQNGGADKCLRTKSLCANSAGSFPQSGVLPVASGFNINKGSNVLNEQWTAAASDQRRLSGAREAQSRTSSENDSALGGSDSRKSSASVGCNLNQLGADPQQNPFGYNPSLRVLIRPLNSKVVRRGSVYERAQSDECAIGSETGATCDQTNATAADSVSNRSILSTLTSIGRQGLRSSNATLNQLEQAEGSEGLGEQLFEIQLVELRNISGKKPPVSCATSPIPNAHAQLSRTSSLLGALVAAATNATGSSTSSGAQSPQLGGSGRRSSIEGVFARVFKHQSGEQHQLASGSVSSGSAHMRLCRVSSGPQQMQLSEQFDSVSVNSNSSSNLASQQSGTDYIQLPLVKVPLSAGQDQAAASNVLVFSEAIGDPNSYTFTCSRSEFPLRISFYQVSKKGSARYTLGHCFVSLNDWVPRSNGEERDRFATSKQNRMKIKRMSSDISSTLSSFNQTLHMMSGVEQKPLKFVTWQSSCDEPQAESATGSMVKAVQLEYCLYQTIFEAIPTE